MTAEQAIRYLHHQAALCRSIDRHEAFCLLLPPLLTALGLRPMNGYEAAAFQQELKKSLNQKKCAGHTGAATKGNYKWQE